MKNVLAVCMNKLWSYGLWHLVVLSLDSHVIEDNAISTFSHEDEAACFSKILISTDKATQYHSPEHHNLNTHCHENLKFLIHSYEV